MVQSVLPAGAKLLIIGEAPGADEDRLGKPFIGRSGEMLDQVLHDVGLDRSTIAIANAVACKPPVDIRPLPKFVRACKVWLDMEINDLKPTLIVTLGAVPTSMALPGAGQISRLRGHLFDHEQYGCKVLPMFHPAYILRKGGIASSDYGVFKKDFQLAKDFIEGKYSGPNQIPGAYGVDRQFQLKERYIRKKLKQLSRPRVAQYAVLQCG